MDNLSHGRVIGIDVSRDWLDLHCLPDGHRCRVPNAPPGHAAVADLAGTEMPSSVLSRLAVKNGSSGRFWRQKVLQPAKCPPHR